ncbi:hypothetical protein MRX96_048602 [Rhipicephalus microplus]
MSSSGEPDSFEEEESPAVQPAAVGSDVPTLDKANASAAQRLKMDASPSASTQAASPPTENASRFVDNETVAYRQAAPDEVYDYQGESSLIDEDAPNATETFCGTAACQDVVRFLQRQLNASHDPCSSLYDHVCSRWQRQYNDQASDDGRNLRG